MVSFPRVWSTIIVGAMMLGTLCACTTNHTFPVLVEPVRTATPRPPIDPTAISCADLLSSAGEAAYSAAGFVEIDDYAARQLAGNTAEAAFVDYGGALCQWGIPNTDTADVFGASAIDADQLVIQKARLDAEGYTVRPHNGGDLYVLGHESGIDSYYLIVGGFWFFANSEAGVDRIRQNADVG